MANSFIELRGIWHASIDAFKTSLRLWCPSNRLQFITYVEKLADLERKIIALGIAPTAPSLGPAPLPEPAPSSGPPQSLRREESTSETDDAGGTASDADSAEEKFQEPTKGSKRSAVKRAWDNELKSKHKRLASVTFPDMRNIDSARRELGAFTSLVLHL